MISFRFKTAVSIVAALFASTLALAAGAAHADGRFCNYSSYPILLAVEYPVGDNYSGYTWKTTGWWRLAHNDCTTTIVSGDMTNMNMYFAVFNVATSQFSRFDDRTFDDGCAKAEDFYITGNYSNVTCPAGYSKTRFYKFTGAQYDATFSLTD